MGGQRVDDLKPDIFRSTGRAPHNPEVGGSDPPPRDKTGFWIDNCKLGHSLTSWF